MFNVPQLSIFLIRTRNYKFLHVFIVGNNTQLAFSFEVILNNFSPSTWGIRAHNNVLTVKVVNPEQKTTSIHNLLREFII